MLKFEEKKRKGQMNVNARTDTQRELKITWIIEFSFWTTIFFSFALEGSKECVQNIHIFCKDSEILYKKLTSILDIIHGGSEYFCFCLYYYNSRGQMPSIRKETFSVWKILLLLLDLVFFSSIASCLLSCFLSNNISQI